MKKILSSLIVFGAVLMLTGCDCCDKGCGCNDKCCYSSAKTHDNNKPNT